MSGLLMHELCYVEEVVSGIAGGNKQRLCDDIAEAEKTSRVCVSSSIVNKNTRTAFL